MNRAIVLETDFVELFGKREMILMSPKLWRQEEFAEYALWQTGRISGDTAKFIYTDYEMQIYIKHISIFANKPHKE